MLVPPSCIAQTLPPGPSQTQRNQGELVVQERDVEEPDGITVPEGGDEEVIEILEKTTFKVDKRRTSFKSIFFIPSDHSY